MLMSSFLLRLLRTLLSLSSLLLLVFDIPLLLLLLLLLVLGILLLLLGFLLLLRHCLCRSLLACLCFRLLLVCFRFDLLLSCLAGACVAIRIYTHSLSNCPILRFGPECHVTFCRSSCSSENYDFTHLGQSPALIKVCKSHSAYYVTRVVGSSILVDVSAAACIVAGRKNQFWAGRSSRSSIYGDIPTKDSQLICPWIRCSYSYVCSVLEYY